MRALVLGGAGFIGSHLCDRLLADDHEVYCIDNFSSGSFKNIRHNMDNPNFNFNPYSIHSKGMEIAFEEFKPEIVFNLAACKKRIGDKYPNVDLSTNAMGTLTLLRLAERNGCGIFIHSSTGSVYGEADSEITINTPVNPVSYYGISKLTAEMYMKLFKGSMKLGILRYFHVYGSRQNDGKYGGVVARFITQGRRGEDITIFGTGNQVRAFTDVRDVVEANIRSIDFPHEQFIANICSGIKVRICELANFISEKYNVKVQYDSPIEGDIQIFNVKKGTIGDANTMNTDFFGTLEELCSE